MEAKPAVEKDEPKVPAEPPAVATKAAPAPEVEEEFPDPDEDDLDDLDDMLDDFSAVKLDKKPAETTPSVHQQSPAQPKPATAAQAPKSEADPAALDENFSEEDFAKQLQAGMADLLGELEKDPNMQAQFEDIFKQISAAAGEGGDLDLGDLGQGSDANASAAAAAALAGAAAAESATGSSTPQQPAAGAAGAGAAPAPTGEASFQDTIKATMERMRTSGDQATAAASSSTGEDDFMAEMLKSLSSGDFNPEGGEEDFSKMLMGMMDQLTNKEILYEPMKELNDKFPEWMEKNRATTEKEELGRYERQQVVVKEIVDKFEEPGYKDSNQADREYIVDRMQKMQAEGSPPNDLVGDMASAQEAFGGMDEGCAPQ